jgi:ankyrin repeat protein
MVLSSQMLLEAGAPVSEKDLNENEPIHLAAKAGSKDTIHLLKQYGGSVCNAGSNFYAESFSSPILTYCLILSSFSFYSKILICNN